MPSEISESPAREVPLWQTKLASRYYNQRIAHEALAIDTLARQGKIVERLALKQQDGTIGQPGNPEGWEAEAMIHVGDVNIKQSSDKVQPAVVAEQAEASLLAKALPFLLTALLGGGLGSAVPWLLGAFTQQQGEAPPAVQEYVDTTTTIGIGGGEPTMEW